MALDSETGVPVAGPRLREPEARRSGESLKVAIGGQEWHVMIEAALRDQRCRLDAPCAHDSVRGAEARQPEPSSRRRP